VVSTARHIDSAPGTLIRKLSFTVQLSEPEDYKGGDLCLYLGDKPEVMKKEQGFVALFPSYVLHEVKPVTQGNPLFAGELDYWQTIQIGVIDGSLCTNQKWRC
jgi:predicted 2-oxoglutarate/Fe(II)-dependent dioxygenase YbiX